VRAIAAGCDTVLVCGDSVERHVAVLEAIIHAVEEGELDEQVLDDAWIRQRRVKARFIGGERPRRPLTGPALRARVGTAWHQSVAEEIVRG
jgi:beta-glucosidase-like glycosyl hydrolase